MKADTITLKEIFLISCSSLMLMMAYPSYDYEILAWIALVPFFITLRGKTLFNAFLLGLIFGLSFFSITLRWIVNTMINYGGLGVKSSYLILILLSLYLSLYTGVVGLITNWISHNRLVLKYISLPFIWISMELLRTWLFSGFPWLLLGYSQSKALTLIQIADITGVYGVSLLILLINSSISYIVEFFLFANIKYGKIEMSEFNFKLILVPLLILVSCYAYGFAIINNYAYKREDKNIRIAVIQPNIDQSVKWEPTYQKEVLYIHEDMSKKVSKGIELVIWPETATPFYFSTNTNMTKRLYTLVDEMDSYLLFGSPRIEEYNKDKGMRLYNSAFLVSPNKGIQARYDKMHLVPFGEYVPFRDVLFFIDKLVEGIGDFESGKEYSIMEIPSSKFATLICFEIIFPNLVRKFVSKGARFLVNITNDAWFGRSDASYQHFSMVVFRAIENRVPVVRVANTGVSGFIDSLGRRQNETQLFERIAVRSSIHLSPDAPTFYSSFGDVFAFLCLGIAVIFIGYKALM